jgi:AcrR family transcriptional regulator
MKERILQTAASNFFRMGFSHVSMDDLAAEMGISKKTLYKHFDSKEAILKEVLNQRVQSIEKSVSGILEKPETDSLSRLLEIFTVIAQKLSQTGQPFFQDLRKHAPKIWEEVDAHRDRIIRHSFSRVFQTGVKEKYFREDVDPHLIMLIYLASIQRIMNPEALPDLPFAANQVFEGIVKVHLGGILTDRGKHQLQKHPLNHLWSSPTRTS